MPKKSYRSLEDAFWSNVDKRSPRKCWNWIPNVKRDFNFYGSVRYQNKQYLAHRLSYELHYGPILPGLVVMHLCDNMLCVNPKHLKAGSQSDNVRDAYKRGGAGSGIYHVRGSALLNPKEVQEIRNLRGVMTYHDIAGAYDVSYWTVQAVMNGKRWADYDDTGDKGKRMYHAERGRLTPDIVREMKALAATGEWTWKALGEKFDLDSSTVRKVCIGERWKDIEGPQPVKRGQKLTEQQAACVMHMYGLKSAKETAAQYGLSEVSVHQMWKGKIKKWAHLCAG